MAIDSPWIHLKTIASSSFSEYGIFHPVFLHKHVFSNLILFSWEGSYPWSVRFAVKHPQRYFVEEFLINMMLIIFSVLRADLFRQKNLIG